MCLYFTYSDLSPHYFSLLTEKYIVNDPGKRFQGSNMRSSIRHSADVFKPTKPILPAEMVRIVVFQMRSKQNYKTYQVERMDKQN